MEQPVSGAASTSATSCDVDVKKTAAAAATTTTTGAASSTNEQPKPVVVVRPTALHLTPCTSLLTAPNLLCARPTTIVFDGNIGCGKSTIMSLLGLEDDIEVVREPLDAWRMCNGQNILKLYYENPREHALAFQTHILHSMRTLWERPTTKAIRLLERSPFSSRYIFCEALKECGNLSAADVDFIDRELHRLFGIDQIDLIVYMRTDPATAYMRMRRRARPEERSVTKVLCNSFRNYIDIDYLQALNLRYELWLGSTWPDKPRNAPVVVVDASTDPVTLLHRLLPIVRQADRNRTVH